MKTKTVLLKNKLKNKLGIAMNIDLLFFLGALFFIIFLVVGFNGDVKGKLFGSSASISAIQLAEGAQNTYRKASVFTGITEQALIDNDAVPGSMVAGSNILHQWNDLVTVTTATRNITDDLAVFTYSNVSTDDCASFVNDSESKFLRIDVGGTDVKNLTLAVPMAITPALVGTQCKNGGAPTVDVIFYVGRS